MSDTHDDTIVVGLDEVEESPVTPPASPAQDDMEGPSGHSPDLEVDDDVDFMGEASGLTYEENEPLGIDQKVPVQTPAEPPAADTPY